MARGANGKKGERRKRYKVKEKVESSMLKAAGLPTYQLTNLRTHELTSHSTIQLINQSTICYGFR
jgi:hypothetical protein